VRPLPFAYPIVLWNVQAAVGTSKQIARPCIRASAAPRAGYVFSMYEAAHGSLVAAAGVGTDACPIVGARVHQHRTHQDVRVLCSHTQELRCRLRAPRVPEWPTRDGGARNPSMALRAQQIIIVYITMVELTINN